MRQSLAKKILKNFALIGVALLTLGATPPLAQDTFPQSTPDSNLPPCWRTTENYPHHQQWMQENAPMMSPRGYGRGRWGSHRGMYNPNTVETITGEVISVNSFSSNRGMSQGIHLQVQTGNETFDVHLGPEWYLQNQDLQIQPQDTITITGSKINNFGQPAIIAAEIQKGNQTLILRDDNGIPQWSRWQQNWTR